MQNNRADLRDQDVLDHLVVFEPRFCNFPPFPLDAFPDGVELIRLEAGVVPEHHVPNDLRLFVDVFDNFPDARFFHFPVFSRLGYAIFNISQLYGWSVKVFICYHVIV